MIKSSDIPIRLLITVLILIVLEVLASAFLPLFGLNKYMIPFNILIVLYVGFKLETPYLALIILSLQLVHSLFSIEGWEYGTIAGVLICIVIAYLRDLLHFTSSFITMLTTFIFQILWFLISSSLLYLKFDSFDYIVQKFWRFIPESIILSLLAPVFFSLLDKVWKTKGEGLMGSNV
ncbi:MULTISPECIES: hypothetical protein [Halobacteriovorax]|uniref:Rod shape-determining protein MreD n=1 Tax=Halobacteriovorax vibrionivorans TaxID=2152716 RepID=A0ABY0IGZ2_9BACT|nr:MULTISPECIES: hypothetical protein [Halobacteriovorax]AYF43519.1 hypothetical protein BALOs_0507 [Halobacteriovorax sp. BALOs_7]RZF21912.1 hypothetical protein DAY19_09485 [Halobacteriovorax vibrionivorans]TGD45898.1 hypothetical protein EP118_14190 [Halobacteriovorax sp. Y22]